MNWLVDYSSILNSLENPSNAHLKEGLEAVSSALQLYDLRSELWLSFNGGKDSTVVLHLLRLALFRIRKLNSQFSKYFYFLDFELKKVINCLYFEEKPSFSEMDSFIVQNCQAFRLSLVQFEKDYSQISKLMASHGLKAIILGTRRTDPYCSHLSHFSPSDTKKGFPAFMRVNPIISWDYNQVWSFLRDFKIPYCSLYDEGYTYLGNKSNSLKNAHLLNEDGSYKPAHLCLGVYENDSRGLLAEKKGGQKEVWVFMTRKNDEFESKVENVLRKMKQQSREIKEVHCFQLEEEQEIKSVFRKEWLAEEKVSFNYDGRKMKLSEFAFLNNYKNVQIEEIL